MAWTFIIISSRTINPPLSSLSLSLSLSLNWPLQKPPFWRVPSVNETHAAKPLMINLLLSFSLRRNYQLLTGYTKEKPTPNLLAFSNMPITTSRLEQKPVERTHPMPPPPSIGPNQQVPATVMQLTLSELKKQRAVVIPLVAMNLTWFAKMAITTAFLGRLGELQLAGGALGFTFANVTGFSVLNGLCGAMEPICGQAFGARNFRLLHKSLFMTTLLLLLTSVPISFLWLNVDKILLQFGQQGDISIVAKRYLLYLLPDLVVTSLLCPLKAYLSSQSLTVPIMLSTALGVAFHVPVNILLSHARGLDGVSMAVWVTDLIIVVLLASYVLISENGKGSGNGREGGWLEQGIHDWIKLLKLCAPCCLTTCLEWWCYEILVLLTGRLENAQQAVGVLAIVLNFDYLLYSVMLSLSTCASIRVSNELGANQAGPAHRSAYVSLAVSIASGFLGGLVMIAARGIWGPLFSHDRRVIRGVKKTLLLMALVEVVNFPLAVCGGIVRGTARPSLGMYASLGGFYFLALPIGVVLAFKVHLGLEGLLAGFFVGMLACLVLLLVFLARIDWDEEAGKAQILARRVEEVDEEDEDKQEFSNTRDLGSQELSVNRYN